MFWKILGTTKSKKSLLFFLGGGEGGGERGMGGTYHSSHHGFVFGSDLFPVPFIFLLLSFRFIIICQVFSLQWQVNISLWG